MWEIGFDSTPQTTLYTNFLGIGADIQLSRFQVNKVGLDVLRMAGEPSYERCCSGEPDCDIP
jgi:hypothetical protein